MGHAPERGLGRPLPPPPRPPPPSPPPPPRPRFPPIDREQTCPFLLRTFLKLGSHHNWEDFAQAARGIVPQDEIQIYTWKDATLGELTDLVKSVVPEARRRDARLSFALVFPDIIGIFRVRPVGRTLSYGEGRLDDHKMLQELGFDIGDFLDVAIQ